MPVNPAYPLLQDFHAAIGRLVVEYAGTVERLTGEGMMVFFNDPVPQPDAALRAVRMAVAMRDRSRELAAHWEQRGFNLDVGFGIAQGYATLGAIGFDERSEYAAIGTVTWMAARLCEIAQPGEILISQRVRAAVADEISCEPAGEPQLRGFQRPVAAFRALRENTPGISPVAISGNGGDREGVPRLFRREGEYWAVAYEGASFRLRDSKGLNYIAHLLRSPEREFHVLDLIALSRSDGDARPVAADGEDLDIGGLGDAGVILDARAKSAYRERLDELRSELGEAESFADAGRISQLREEIEQLSHQLAAAVGLGGRDRRVGAAAERARVNVTRAISDSVKRIREFSPALARHLEASIRTGAFCAYRPADSTWHAWEP